MVHRPPHRREVHQEGSTENKPTSHTSKVRFLKHKSQRKERTKAKHTSLRVSLGRVLFSVLAKFR